MEPARHTLEHDSRRRTHLLLTPPTVGPDTPVVVVLHGSTQTPAAFRKATGNAFDVIAERFGALVVLPSGYRRTWNDGRIGGRHAAQKADIDDVGYLRALHADLRTRFGLPDGKFFVVGFSNGGGLALHLALQSPALVHAAVAVGTARPVDEEFPQPSGPALPVPIALVHGTADAVVPHAGGQAKLLGVLPRGRGLSATETAQWFAARNGASPDPVRTELPSHGATRVLRDEFTGDVPVVQYTVVGGGHTIPGPKPFPRLMGATNHDLDTATMTAQFFGLTPR